MKIFPTNLIKKLDEYTIEYEGIQSIDLMERASICFTNSIIEKWDNDKPVVVFAGPGNNGGDALAVARLLSEKGYSVEVFLFNTQNSLSNDCEINKNRLKDIADIIFNEITSQFTPPQLTSDHLIIDGLFGSGLNKPLTGGFAAVVQRINSSSSTVVSLDMPSGLMGEDNTYNTRANIVHADLTLSIQFPKLSFLFAENAEFIGKWELIDINLINELSDTLNTSYELLEVNDVKPLIKARQRFSHKGTFGHALLIAGSYGMAGASVLSAKACLYSGVGLLTIHSPFNNNNILQTSVPEAIVENDIHEYHYSEATDTNEYQAIAIGPGIGQNEITEMALLNQLQECQEPIILDADALNIIAKNRQIIKYIPPKSILTPHPKELERLIGKCQNSYERLTKAAQFAQDAQVYMIVKGAFTAIITPENYFYFNSTGNPGMATAGSGDVLTGILLGLMAQGYDSEDACKLGVFAHGLAGDIAKEKYGEISMTASSIITYLPMAFKLLSE